MQEYRKGSHTVYDIKYHLVWITKYRYKILKGDMGIRIRDIIREVCMSCDVKIVKGNVSADHILVSVPPNLSISQLMQYIKGKSSFRIQQEYPLIRKRYWGQHIWARGYFCATTGNVTEETIIKYIENQKHHHEEDGFKVEE